MGELGPLLASGRDSDIFEYGAGLVLRRSRGNRSMTSEARIMDFVREQGFPVPAIHEISSDGTELIMERIVGPSMLTVLGQRPWAISSQAALLAGLHQGLHRIPAPDWVRDAPGGTGNQLLHLDLHPNNIMIGATGPVVIDWSNAARGDGDTDVALTWVLLASAGVPAGRATSALLGLARSSLVRMFLKDFDLDRVKVQLPAVVEWKLTDPNMDSDERAAMRKLLVRAE